ncbi:MAG TPA: hypothetical protein HA367_01250, partial [Candidatus Methanofastidiosum sp.]|nr:hypothetical protein [Methanofastidiosum sp.]
TAKTFTDTEITANTITFTAAHGFGTIGQKVNLKFNTTAGTPPTGLVNNTVYQFTITSAVIMTLSGIGIDASGDFEGKLTNSYNITNSIAIGTDVNCTKANQAILGNSSVTETILRGNVLATSIETTGNVTITGDLYRSRYAEMYISEASDPTDIITAAVYQPMYPNAIASSLVAGFTFSGGEVVAITSTADAGGGLVRCTTAGHTIAQGDMVTIRGTTDYNGHFIVKAVTATTFDITVAYVSDQSGTAMKPDQFTAGTGTGGVKRNAFSLTGQSAGNAKDYTFSFLVYDKTTDAFIECPKCTKAVRTQLATEKFSVATSTLRNWVVGDKIAVVVKCADTTDMTINNLDFNIL